MKKIDNSAVRHYMMGKIVTVHWTFKRINIYESGGIVKNWEHEFHSNPRAGWVVGFRNIHDGKSEYLGLGEGCNWVKSRSHHCMLVVYWPNMKAVNVPFKDVAWTMGGEPVLTKKYFNSIQKGFIKEAAKVQPRGKDGRWIKA